MVVKTVAETGARIERKWLVLLAVGVGTFMSALDASVVNTVLPVINRSLASRVAVSQWTVTAYLLVVSGLLLTFGRLGDLRGHKRFYVAGFAVFVIASALCGVAPSAAALIASRTLQAVGAAILFANSPAILTANFPPTQRGEALGWQATMTYIGLTLGPALGGYIAGRFTWRAVFYLNVPVGLLALWLSIHFVPDDARDAGLRLGQSFDLAGAVLWICGLLALLLGLDKGHEWGWSSATIIFLLVSSLALLGAFVAVEARVTDPMLDLKLFRSRSFSAATVSAVLNFVCIYSTAFLLPFYLIQARGLSPARTGLLLTAQSLVRAVIAPASGTLSDRIGTHIPAMLGMGITAVAMFLFSRVGPGSSFAYVILALVIVGLGTGLFVSPNSSALMGSAPFNRQGIAAATLATARNVGMVLGVGSAGAVFTTALAADHSPAAIAVSHSVAAGFLMATTVALLGVPICAAAGSRPPQS